MDQRVVAVFGWLLALLVVPSGCHPPPTQAPAALPARATPIHHATPAARDPSAVIDPDDDAGIAAALAGDGLDGWMHGAAAASGLFVFTYRLPNDFFRYADFPMIPGSPEVARELAGLQRHDRLRVFGSLEKKGPQRHVRVRRIEVLTRFSSGVDAPSYAHDTTTHAALLGGRALVGRVHGVDAEGKILVVELADKVVPVFVTRPEHVRDLWRNDKIRLHYVIAEHPDRPIHLRLDPAVSRPIEVLERVQAGHGQPIELEGDLVLFPRSPQIKFDIWALRVVDRDRVEREYTLVNFSDPELFKAIRDKLARGWAAHPGAPVDARNKFIKQGLRVRARGVLNVISPAQANPQILLSSEGAVEVLGAPGPGSPPPVNR
jgi:hypothetical protein